MDPPTALEMIAIDTNLLVYAHRRGTPEHRAARRAIEKAATGHRGWGIALPSLGDFWSIVTHPEAAGGPSSPERAASFIQALVNDGGARIWHPGPGFGEGLLQWATDLEIYGVRISDLQIALLASENGATDIWTHDRNFVSIPGLGTADPL